MHIKFAICLEDDSKNIDVSLRVNVWDITATNGVMVDAKSDVVRFRIIDGHFVVS